MILIVSILVIVNIILFTIILNYKKEFRNVSRQINKNVKTYTNLKTKSIDKDFEKLIENINFLYDENQKISAEKKNFQDDLRKSISNMAHDLRTPLTSIMGYLQLIKADKTLDEQKVEYMNIVEKRTRSLQNLITSFYELSRVDEKEYKFKLENINLYNILCENVAAFYNDFIEKNIEPVIELDDKDSNIICDENAVNRIFSNLINNMLKYGEDKVKIVLRAGNNKIITEFINKASNLTEEDVNKLFERFYIADKSRSTGSTGLGLCITKSLVEELGHEIYAELNNEELVIKIIWNK